MSLFLTSRTLCCDWLLPNLLAGPHSIERRQIRLRGRFGLSLRRHRADWTLCCATERKGANTRWKRYPAGSASLILMVTVGRTFFA